MAGTVGRTGPAPARSVDGGTTDRWTRRLRWPATGALVDDDLAAYEDLAAPYAPRLGPIDSAGQALGPDGALVAERFGGLEVSGRFREEQFRIARLARQRVGGWSRPPGVRGFVGNDGGHVHGAALRSEVHAVERANRSTVGHGGETDVQQCSGREDDELGSGHGGIDRKSTRLNSSHVAISYAVFCLKKKNEEVAEHAGVT